MEHIIERNKKKLEAQSVVHLLWSENRRKRKSNSYDNDLKFFISPVCYLDFTLTLSQYKPKTT